jgi:tetratricopeptide (TPR) repeat protein
VECLALRKAILGASHPDTLQSMNNLANLYENQGKYDEAEPLYVECLALCKAILGASHPDTLQSMNNLAGLYQNQGKYDQAKEIRAKQNKKQKTQT